MIRLLIALAARACGRLYVHSKGGRYVRLCTADESTNTRLDLRLGETRPCVVVYLSLSTLRVHVRDLGEWFGSVRWQDGYHRPRFVRADRLARELRDNVPHWRGWYP